MNQSTIKRSPKSIFETIMWIVFYGLYVSTTSRKEYFLWNLLYIFAFVLMLLYIIKLCIELKYPEMEIKNGKICFLQRRPKLKWYVRLPIDRIECVFENYYQVHYISKKKFLPWFTFVMKNGQKFDYLPYGESDERLNEVGKFMQNIADYSIPIKFKSESEK